MAVDEVNKNGSTTEVEYRPINGFPGYRAGTDGSIWSNHVLGIWKRLKGCKNKWGYIRITMQRNSVPHNYFAHVLILETFVGPRPQGMQTCHGNGITSDNRLENLRWGTKADNVADNFRLGTIKYGENHKSAKLSFDAIEKIRGLYKTGEYPQNELAKMFNVDSSWICRIVNCKRRQAI